MEDGAQVQRTQAWSRIKVTCMAQLLIPSVSPVTTVRTQSQKREQEHGRPGYLARPYGSSGRLIWGWNRLLQIGEPIYFPYIKRVFLQK